MIKIKFEQDPYSSFLPKPTDTQVAFSTHRELAKVFEDLVELNLHLFLAKF